MKKSFFFSCYFLISSLFTVACGTIRVRVAVMRPAEVTLPGDKAVVIGKIAGPGAEPIAKKIKEAIATSPYLKLQMPTDLDQRGSVAAGDISVITGAVSSPFVEEKAWKREDTCESTFGNQKSSTPRCVFYTRQAVATVELDMEVRNMNSGTSFFNKPIVCVQYEQSSYTEKKTALNDFVNLLGDVADLVNGSNGKSIRNLAPAIDHQALIRRCDQDLALQILRVVSPWEDLITVQLQKDRRLPLLREGIKFVKAGDWDMAMNRFSEAQKMVETMPQLPAKTVGKVYWDLGLSYLYKARFDDARACIQNAYRLTANRTYKKQLDAIDHMQHEHEKLLEQTQTTSSIAGAPRS